MKYTRFYSFAEPSTPLELQFGPTGILDPVSQEEDIHEQTLLHLDVGAGYWFYLNPRARYVKGLAGLLELHYTTTLTDADRVVIPADPGVTRTLESIRQQRVVPQTENAVIGNLANRLDILNITTGTSLLVGNRATVATAFAFPLRQGSDKLFDWEFNLQVNYYFGGPARTGTTYVPNLQ